MKLKSILVSMLGVSAAVMFTATADAAPRKKAKTSNLPVYVGCTSSEGLCKSVLTTFSGSEYNVESAVPAIRAGRAVAVYGETSGISIICFKSRINVVSWHYVKMRCPKPAR
jgi:hypothetical protein